MKFIKSTKPTADIADEQLLQDYHDTGSLTILGALYERYMPLVYGVCLKHLGDEDQSKDAVMQIFEELIVKANKFEIKNFKSWLYTLSRNYCLMQLRSGKKMQSVQLDDFMEIADELHPIDKENDLTALERCKEKLPDAQKISIQLFYIDEKCYKEIADDTGYSMNEVKSYIQNGKRNLKICLEKTRER